MTAFLCQFLNSWTLEYATTCLAFIGTSLISFMFINIKSCVLWRSYMLVYGCVAMVTESLNELSDMVTVMFNGVTNKDVIIPQWPIHPYGPNEVKVSEVACTLYFWIAPAVHFLVEYIELLTKSCFLPSEISLIERVLLHFYAALKPVVWWQCYNSTCYLRPPLQLAKCGHIIWQVGFNYR